jgi:hypothetical protein
LCGRLPTLFGDEDALTPPLHQIERSGAASHSADIGWARQARCLTGWNMDVWPLVSTTTPDLRVLAIAVGLQRGGDKRALGDRLTIIKRDLISWVHFFLYLIFVLAVPRT